MIRHLEVIDWFSQKINILKVEKNEVCLKYQYITM